MSPNDKTVLLQEPCKGEIQSPSKDVWCPKTASMTTLDDAGLRSAIEESSKEGVLIVEGLGSGAPFEHVGSLMDLLHSDQSLGRRLNAAYSNNLVYKDSWGEGNGGANVDEKRVLDVSEQRMEVISNRDLDLLADLGLDFERVWQFFNDLDPVVQRLLNALASVIGDTALFLPGSVRKNFRMVDYHARPSESAAPRCGEHRDFGPLTLIFQDGKRSGDGGGLQVHLGGTWRDVPVPKAAGSAVVLFGICTAWRSNDRVSAVKHRVVNPRNMPGEQNAQVKRRLSAVLFVGPREDSKLAPLLVSGERPLWKSGVVKDVRQFVARKWKHREGTVSCEEAQAEEELKKHLPTQDDAIEYFYKIPQW